MEKITDNADFNGIDNYESDGNTSFLRAARNGQLEKVLEYLKTDIDINTSNANGLNALHLASKDGHVEIVEELLKRGAIVDAATKKGNTALHIASLAGQEEVVKLLVQHGASVNVQSQNGFTPLYMAAQENHDNVVKFLLANGANQSLSTEDGFTPLAVAMQQGHDKVVTVLLENDTRGKVRLPALHIAAKKDDVRAAKLLLENDHNPDVTSKSGFTPLHIASHYGNQSIANLLIQKGADVNYSAKHNITPLHVAAKWGKSNMVSLLLEQGAHIEAKTRDGLTPLHCAARSGHEQVVDMLLEKSAPISSKTKNGLAPLHMAAQGDHVDAARILLYHRAPVDEVTVDYLTALHVAAHCGHVRVAKLLLDRQADANARALNGFTPLHIACKKNRIKVVELLLKHGACIGATTESGLTPLHVASFMGCMNIVIYLLQHDASPDIPTVRGETPLHLAARANQTDIIRILLRNGAQVDARAREQQTPLHVASRLGNVDIAMLLLQHGAKIDNTTKDMYTSLHIAAKEGQDEVAAVLIENGASLNSTTKKGFTPLHLAAKYGHLKVAKLLVQKEAPVDAQGKNGVTPLHVASHYDHQNVALLLLDKGASPHANAKNGHTPLHIAARKNQMDIANTLLEYGAKPDVESKAGFTPLHLSSQEGHVEISSLLLEHKATPDYQSKNGLTPMHLCAQENKVAVAELLHKNGAEIESQTKGGYTPLHIACHYGQADMVKFLLSKGADVKATTSLGYTPLHQAAQQGHTNIVNLLLENSAQPNAFTNNGQTPLHIAQKLGYITVIDTLKKVTDSVQSPVLSEDKYRVVAPELMHETFLSDSEEEGEDTLLGDQTYRYLTADEMKSLGDDSLPIDVTRDERVDSNRMVGSDDANAYPPRHIEDSISPEHIHPNYVEYIKKATDNVDISRHPVNIGFLVSFLVDARGGAMRGCRHSGVRVIVPPRCAPSPTRITCRYVRPQRTPHPPPLMEGEALASRVLELGPVGAKFLGPVIIEVPHFAALRGKEREIVILRSDNGESWKEHTIEATEDVLNEVLRDSFDNEDLNQLEDTSSGRTTRIITQDFPQYFAVISRIRQEVHAIGPEGGMVSSTVVPQVQAVFPQGALTKKIKVGLQAQPIDPELTAKLLGHGVAVSPVVTVEPRRRKFHKAITLSMPAPRAHSQGMINQYSGSAPTLRLLCSITGGTSRAQWEDVTGSTPLTFVNDCVSFTTTVSARFWLMDCRNIGDATKMATELYREAIHVPFIAKFVVFAKRIDPLEARLRVFCMTDDKEEKTLEYQEQFTEIAKSRDVEVMEGKSQYIEFAGNLVPITKSGEQLEFSFRAFKENRLPFSVRVKDQHAEAVSRCLFMREPKVQKGEPPQQPICILNIVLPDDIVCETISLTDSDSIRKKYYANENFDYYRQDPRLADISNLLGEDWVELANQLGLTSSEINVIKSEYPDSVAKQAQSMLRMWLSQSGNRVQTNTLENALLRIGRDDIANQCLNVDNRNQEILKIRTEEKGNHRLISDNRTEDISSHQKHMNIKQEIITRRIPDNTDKYSAEEKSFDPSDEEEDFNKTVPERREQIVKRLSTERTIPASSQRVEIVQEISSIKRQSLVEDKIAEVQQKANIEPMKMNTIKPVSKIIQEKLSLSEKTDTIEITETDELTERTLIEAQGNEKTEDPSINNLDILEKPDRRDSVLLEEVTQLLESKKPVTKIDQNDANSPKFSKTPPPSPADFIMKEKQATTIQEWNATEDCGKISRSQDASEGEDTSGITTSTQYLIKVEEKLLHTTLDPPKVSYPNSEIQKFTSHEANAFPQIEPEVHIQTGISDADYISFNWKESDKKPNGDVVKDSSTTANNCSIEEVIIEKQDSEISKEDMHVSKMHGLEEVCLPESNNDVVMGIENAFEDTKYVQSDLRIFKNRIAQFKESQHTEVVSDKKISEDSKQGEYIKNSIDMDKYPQTCSGEILSEPNISKTTSELQESKQLMKKKVDTHDQIGHHERNTSNKLNEKGEKALLEDKDTESYQHDASVIIYAPVEKSEATIESKLLTEHENTDRTGQPQTDEHRKSKEEEPNCNKISEIRTNDYEARIPVLKMMEVGDDVIRLGEEQELKNCTDKMEMISPKEHWKATDRESTKQFLCNEKDNYNDGKCFQITKENLKILDPYGDSKPMAKSHSDCAPPEIEENQEQASQILDSKNKKILKALKSDENPSCQKPKHPEETKKSGITRFFRTKSEKPMQDENKYVDATKDKDLSITDKKSRNIFPENITSNAESSKPVSVQDNEKVNIVGEARADDKSMTYNMTQNGGTSEELNKVTNEFLSIEKQCYFDVKCSKFQASSEDRGIHKETGDARIIERIVTSDNNDKMVANNENERQNPNTIEHNDKNTEIGIMTIEEDITSNQPWKESLELKTASFAFLMREKEEYDDNTEFEFKDLEDINEENNYNIDVIDNKVETESNPEKQSNQNEAEKLIDISKIHPYLQEKDKHEELSRNVLNLEPELAQVRQVPLQNQKIKDESYQIEGKSTKNSVFNKILTKNSRENIPRNEEQKKWDSTENYSETKDITAYFLSQEKTNYHDAINLTGIFQTQKTNGEQLMQNKNNAQKIEKEPKKSKKVSWSRTDSTGLSEKDMSSGNEKNYNIPENEESKKIYSRSDISRNFLSQEVEKYEDNIYHAHKVRILESNEPQIIEKPLQTHLKLQPKEINEGTTEVFVSPTKISSMTEGFLKAELSNYYDSDGSNGSKESPSFKTISITEGRSESEDDGGTKDKNEPILQQQNNLSGTNELNGTIECDDSKQTAGAIGYSPKQLQKISSDFLNTELISYQDSKYSTATKPKTETNMCQNDNDMEIKRIPRMFMDTNRSQDNLENSDPEKMIQYNLKEGTKIESGTINDMTQIHEREHLEMVKRASSDFLFNEKEKYERATHKQAENLLMKTFQKQNPIEMVKSLDTSQDERTLTKMLEWTNEFINKEKEVYHDNKYSNIQEKSVNIENAHPSSIGILYRANENTETSENQTIKETPKHSKHHEKSGFMSMFTRKPKKKLKIESADLPKDEQFKKMKGRVEKDITINGDDRNKVASKVNNEQSAILANPSTDEFLRYEISNYHDASNVRFEKKSGPEELVIMHHEEIRNIFEPSAVPEESHNTESAPQKNEIIEEQRNEIYSGEKEMLASTSDKNQKPTTKEESSGILKYFKEKLKTVSMRESDSEENSKLDEFEKAYSELKTETSSFLLKEKEKYEDSRCEVIKDPINYEPKTGIDEESMQPSPIKYEEQKNEEPLLIECTDLEGMKQPCNTTSRSPTLEKYTNKMIDIAELEIEQPNNTDIQTSTDSLNLERPQDIETINIKEEILDTKKKSIKSFNIPPTAISSDHLQLQVSSASNDDKTAKDNDLDVNVSNKIKTSKKRGILGFLMKKSKTDEGCPSDQKSLAPQIKQESEVSGPEGKLKNLTSIESIEEVNDRKEEDRVIKKTGTVMENPVRKKSKKKLPKEEETIESKKGILGFLFKKKKPKNPEESTTYYTADDFLKILDDTKTFLDKETEMYDDMRWSSTSENPKLITQDIIPESYSEPRALKENIDEGNILTNTSFFIQNEINNYYDNRIQTDSERSRDEYYVDIPEYTAFDFIKEEIETFENSKLPNTSKVDSSIRIETEVETVDGSSPKEIITKKIIISEKLVEMKDVLGCDASGNILEKLMEVNEDLKNQLNGNKLEFSESAEPKMTASCETVDLDSVKSHEDKIKHFHVENMDRENDINTNKHEIKTVESEMRKKSQENIENECIIKIREIEQARSNIIEDVSLLEGPIPILKNEKHEVVTDLDDITSDELSSVDSQHAKEIEEMLRDKYQEYSDRQISITEENIAKTDTDNKISSPQTREHEKLISQANKNCDSSNESSPIKRGVITKLNEKGNTLTEVQQASEDFVTDLKIQYSPYKKEPAGMEDDTMNQLIRPNISEENKTIQFITKRKPMFRIESEEENLNTSTENKSTVLLNEELDKLCRELKSSSSEFDSADTKSKEKMDVRGEEITQSARADIEDIERKLLDLGNALDTLEQSEYTENNEVREKKLRRVERKFERMASETDELATVKTQTVKLSKPAENEQYQQLVSQLSQDEVMSFQGDYNNLWDEYTFSKSDEWDSKTPDSQADVLELPQGETSQSSEPFDTTISKGQQECPSEKGDASIRQQPVDQHQLSSEMKDLLKEMEEASKK